MNKLNERLGTNEHYKDPSRLQEYSLRDKKLSTWEEKEFLIFYTSDFQTQKFILGSRNDFQGVNKAYLYALYSKAIGMRAHMIIKESLKIRLQELKEKWSFSGLEEILGKYADIILAVELTGKREPIKQSQPLLQPPPQT